MNALKFISIYPTYCSFTMLPRIPYCRGEEGTVPPLASAWSHLPCQRQHPGREQCWKPNHSPDDASIQIILQLLVVPLLVSSSSKHLFNPLNSSIFIRQDCTTLVIFCCGVLVSRNKCTKSFTRFVYKMTHLVM